MAHVSFVDGEIWRSGLHRSPGYETPHPWKRRDSSKFSGKESELAVSWAAPLSQRPVSDVPLSGIVPLLDWANSIFHRMGFDWGLSILPYGDWWRQSRKLLHAHVHSAAASAYQPGQLISARRLVVELINAKHNKDILSSMIRTNFGIATIKMVYGIDVKSGEDEYITFPEQVVHAISEAGAPGRFFVDILPICASFLSMFMSSVVTTLLTSV
jgi:hypothetical protein